MKYTQILCVHVATEHCESNN